MWGLFTDPVGMCYDISERYFPILMFGHALIDTEFAELIYSLKTNSDEIEIIECSNTRKIDV